MPFQKQGKHALVELSDDIWFSEDLEFFTFQLQLEIKKKNIIIILSKIHRLVLNSLAESGLFNIQNK
jgi:hypothetical protein